MHGYWLPSARRLGDLVFFWLTDVDRWDLFSAKLYEISLRFTLKNYSLWLQGRRSKAL